MTIIAILYSNIFQNVRLEYNTSNSTISQFHTNPYLEYNALIYTHAKPAFLGYIIIITPIYSQQSSITNISDYS